MRRDVAAEEQQEDSQGGGNRDNIDRDHHRGIVDKAQPKEIRRDDIHQVRHHQRQARHIGNKPRRHDKRQGRGGTEAQGQQHGDDDGGEDQGGAIIGEQGRHRRAQQDDQGEQKAAMSTPPARATCSAAHSKKPASSSNRLMMIMAMNAAVAFHTMCQTATMSCGTTTPANRAMTAPRLALQPIPSPFGCHLLSVAR